MAMGQRVSRLASLLLDPEEESIDVRSLPPAVEPLIADVSSPGGHLGTGRVSTQKRARTPNDVTLAVRDTQFPGARVRSLGQAEGIEFKLIRQKFDVMPSSGAVFGHAENACHRFIQSRGGPELAVFKVGITSNPTQRWTSYVEQNFQYMMVMLSSDDLSLVEALEAHLVRLFKALPGCRNDLPGGESMRCKDRTPRFSGPYHCYIVGSPANLNCRIGS
jgi:hypothetical protein